MYLEKKIHEVSVLNVKTHVLISSSNLVMYVSAKCDKFIFAKISRSIFVETSALEIMVLLREHTICKLILLRILVIKLESNVILWQKHPVSWQCQDFLFCLFFSCQSLIDFSSCSQLNWNYYKFSNHSCCCRLEKKLTVCSQLKACCGHRWLCVLHFVWSAGCCHMDVACCCQWCFCGSIAVKSLWHCCQPDRETDHCPGQCNLMPSGYLHQGGGGMTGTCQWEDRR